MLLPSVGEARKVENITVLVVFSFCIGESYSVRGAGRKGQPQSRTVPEAQDFANYCRIGLRGSDPRGVHHRGSGKQLRALKFHAAPYLGTMFSALAGKSQPQRPLRG